VKKIKRFFLYWAWQSPQMLAGAVLSRALKAGKRVYTAKDGRKIEWFCFRRNTRFSKFISGFSLASFILLTENDEAEEDICHEYGHSAQSLYLGWLYLPVIGIYSAVFCNLWDRRFHKSWSYEKRIKWYYSRWSEAWADSLGGVKRP
jgi:hypothetical protein